MSFSFENTCSSQPSAFSVSLPADCGVILGRRSPGVNSACIAVTITIRPAAAADAEAICTIHNQGITDRLATLDTALGTTAERRSWIADRNVRHPVIVADVNATVVGWASLNRFNPREAY